MVDFQELWGVFRQWSGTTDSEPVENLWKLRKFEKNDQDLIQLRNWCDVKATTNHTISPRLSTDRKKNQGNLIFILMGHKLKQKPLKQTELFFPPKHHLDAWDVFSRSFSSIIPPATATVTRRILNCLENWEKSFCLCKKLQENNLKRILGVCEVHWNIIVCWKGQTRSLLSLRVLEKPLANKFAIFCCWLFIKDVFLGGSDLFIQMLQDVLCEQPLCLGGHSQKTSLGFVNTS
jgi:hypothetical protein